jgi:hypothetical protein
MQYKAEMCKNMYIYVKICIFQTTITLLIARETTRLTQRYVSCSYFVFICQLSIEIFNIGLSCFHYPKGI